MFFASLFWISDLERENKRLVVENSKLQDMVYNFEKQRDELQTEISELQILVEDLKTRVSIKMVFMTNNVID